MGSFTAVKKLGLFLGLLLVVLGIILLIFPDKVIEMVAFILGIAFIVFGVFKIVGIFLRWKENPPHKIPVLLGAACALILGIYLLINMNATIRAVGIAIGIFALVCAADRFMTAYARKQAGEHGVLYTILFGLVHAAFGIGMLYAAFAMMTAIIMIVGIYLLVAGIMIIVSTTYLMDF